jgi:Polysaccharide pyruvyl transferase
MRLPRLHLSRAPALRRRVAQPRALLVGWFSLPFGGATAGDLAVLDVVRSWLDDAGYPHDVALGEPFTGGVNWRSASPSDYSHVVHVCGPVSPDLEVAHILDRFSECRLVAVNVSLVLDRDDWNPFTDLLERDGGRTRRADLAFTGDGSLVPLVGIVLVHPQIEYPNASHARANSLVREFLHGRDVCAVPVDTRLDANPDAGLGSAVQVESLLARMDVVLSTRLHGLVFALRNGVPAVAIDPIPGGAKVKAQAESVGWPATVSADLLDADRLGDLYEWCLTQEARTAARACAARGRAGAEDVRHELLAALRRS